MKKIITIFLVLHSLFSFAQCQLNLLAGDLSKSNKEFKEIVNEASGFNAWQILEVEATALRTDINELTLVSKNLEAIKSAKGYLNWKALQGAGDKLWTAIDETDGFWNGRNVTFYDIRVVYQKERPRAGVAFLENNILEFHLNIPEKVQKQGVASEIFKRAIADYSPSKIKGWWKKADIYTGGESTNLTIFKQKLSEGLSPDKAVFETPVGKIIKDNGFDGFVEIIKNADDEVIIYFNPKL
jgi:hypothetical protein